MAQRRKDILLKNVGERVRELRKKKNVSQDTVLIETDINVKRIEIGAVNITLSTVAILCQYFEITLTEFFDGIEIE